MAAMSNLELPAVPSPMQSESRLQLPEEQHEKCEETSTMMAQQKKVEPIKCEQQPTLVEVSRAVKVSEAVEDSEVTLGGAVSGANSPGAESGSATLDSGDSLDEAPYHQGAGARRVQGFPPGWVGSYTIMGSDDNHGYLQYETTCTCRDKKGKPVKRRVDIPHRIMKWALKHGDHRPEYEVLKPKPDEVYPMSSKVGKPRWDRAGWRKYRARMQSLGFYTSVHMLEKAGFHLPEEAQRKWDALRSGGKEAPQPRLAAAHRTGRAKKRGQPASDAEGSSAVGRSELTDAAEGSGEEGVPEHWNRLKRARKAAPAKLRAPRTKRKPNTPPEQPDTPVQVDKGKRRRQPSRAPRIVKRKEAEPSAPEQGAPAGPSELPRAAAPSTPVAAPVKAEVVDLTADSPRASSCTQLPFSGLDVAHAAPDQASPGHEAAASIGGNASSPSDEAAQKLPAANASLPPATAHAAPAAAAASRNGVYTLDDVIADVTQLKALEAQIAAAGVQLDFDQILQCLHSANLQQGLAEQQAARIGELQGRAGAMQKEHEAALADMTRRAEKSERLLTHMDEEISSLRSQMDILKA